MPRKFIILCHGRCGSTFLQQELDKVGELENEISSWGEIYNENYIKRITSLDDPYWMKRQENPIEFFDFICTKMGRDVNVVKILYPQINEHALHKLIESESSDYKIIFLYRKNILEAAVSMIVSHKTQEWHIRRGQIAKQPWGFNIDYNELENYISNITTFILSCKNKIKIPFFEVVYEELINLNKINEICQFLNVSSKKILTSDTEKQMTDMVYSTIANKNEIEKKYSKMYGYLGRSSPEDLEKIEFWKNIKDCHEIPTSKFILG